MKKIFSYIIVLLVFVFVGVGNVKAASFGKVTGGNTNGSTFKVPISGANGLVLTYDTSKISCGGTNTAIHDNPSGRLISNDNVEVSCTINVKEYYKLNLILVDASENKDSVGITYEINPSLKPTTTPTTPTTAAPTTTTTTAKKSNNANLKSLDLKADDNSVVNLTPTFKSDVYEYSATVSGKIKKVNVTPVVEDTKANVIISDNAYNELSAGENNKIIITVTAEDLSKKAYTINIKREVLAADATLKSLFIKECENFEFDENKFSYNVKLEKKVSSLTLDYLTSSDKATVSVSGNEELEDGSKVKILVTAEDGTKKEYVLNIVKQQVITTTKAQVSNVLDERNPFVIMILCLVAFGLVGIIVYVAKK